MGRSLRVTNRVHQPSAHTVILHHPHSTCPCTCTCIATHGRRARHAVGRLMTSSSILLWIIHHVLLRLLARLGLGLLLVVGVMGLWRCAIVG